MPQEEYYHPHIRSTNTNCHYCNIYVEKYEDRTKDHIIPRSELRKKLTVKERHRLRNHLVMACFECNQAKGNMSYEEFLVSDFLSDRILYVHQNGLHLIQ